MEIHAGPSRPTLESFRSSQHESPVTQASSMVASLLSSPRLVHTVAAQDTRESATSNLHFAGPLPNSHVDQTQSSTVSDERLNTPTESPSVTYLRARFDTRDGGNEEDLHVGASSRLDTVILDTLLWMSGMSRTTDDSAGEGETVDLKTLLKDVNDTHSTKQVGYASFETSREDSQHTPQSRPAVSTTRECESEQANVSQQQLHTPINGRIPVFYCSPLSNNNSEPKRNASVGAGLTSKSSRAVPTDSASLVYTTPNTFSGDGTSRSLESNERAITGIFHQPFALRTEKGDGVAMVGGSQWQAEFATYAQQILRETHKQVEVLRKYQAMAARETQRANQLAEDQRILEKKLMDAEQLQRMAEAKHTDTVGELSRQVLQLDGAVAASRRTQLALEDELEEMRRAAEEQKAAHEEEIGRLTQWYECQLETLRSKEHQLEVKWRSEQERLLSLVKEQWLSPSTQTNADNRHNGLSSRSNAADDTLASRVGEVTTSEDSGSTPNNKEGNMHEQTPYELVHPEVLRQQQLREQTLVSQLSLLETRLQREVEQRQLSEQRVMDLLIQQEELREAAVGTPPHTQKEDSAVEKGVGTSTQTSDQQQQTLLHEIQIEYKKLQKESTALLQRNVAQQHQSAEHWAAVQSHLLPLLEFAGIDSGAFIIGTTNPQDKVVAALQTLLHVLAEQKRVETATRAQERESVRLATLERALLQADEQNNEHRTELEVTVAQLHDAQNELMQWRQRQKQILRRQRQYEEVWSAAEVHFKSVMLMLQRALREYTPPLSHTHAGDGDDLPEISPVASQKSNCEASTINSELQKSSNSPGSVHIDRKVLVEEALEVCEDTNPATDMATPSNPEKSARSGENEAPAEVDVSPLSASTTTATTASCAVNAFADTTPLMAHLERDMSYIVHSFRKLLAAWRTRQHTLVENRKQWKQKAHDALSTNATLREQQQSKEKKLMQQVRLFRNAEQHRTQELEKLKRNWMATQEEQTTKHALALQQLHEEVAKEREDLLGRISAADERTHHVEKMLHKANEDCISLRATVLQLQDTQENAVTAHDQELRRQSDLNIHIENLEWRLREAQQAEVGLRALLTASLSAMVHLVLALQQLRQHYKVLHTLRSDAENVVEAATRILLAASNQASAKGEAAFAAKSLHSKSFPGFSMVSPLGFPLMFSASSSAARLRVVAHAAIAIHRMQRLLLEAKRPNSPSASSPLAPPLFTSPTLNSAFASYGIPSPTLFTATRGSTVCDNLIPSIVRLPHTSELVTPILPLLTLHNSSGNTHETDHQRKVRFQNKDGDVVPQEVLVGGVHRCSTSTTATAQVSKSLLEHLLSVARLDTQAPPTLFLLACFRASTKVETFFRYVAQQIKCRREALYRSVKERSDADAAALLLSIPSLLPLPLATPLQQLLSKASLQACQLSEAQAIVQKLVDQNHRLVSAVETQTQVDETRAMEIDSLTEQLSLCEPQRKEFFALQERLVQSRASLLEERKLRREAEGQLAQLRQEQLQLIGEAERLKREVYGLNMELANISAGDPRPSFLSIRKDEGHTTVGSDAATSVSFAASAGGALRTATQRSTNRYNESDNELQLGHKESIPMRSKGSCDDENYYRQLLRNTRDGLILSEKSKGVDLRYQQRHNIPTAEELAQLLHTSPYKKLAGPTYQSDIQMHMGQLNEAKSASPTCERLDNGLDLFVPKVVQEQQQRMHTGVPARPTALEDPTSVRQDAQQNDAFVMDPEYTASTSPDANIHIVISRSQTKHHKRRESSELTPLILKNTSPSPFPLHAPPFIPTGASMSALLSPHPLQAQSPSHPPSTFSNTKDDGLSHREEVQRKKLPRKKDEKKHAKQTPPTSASALAPSTTTISPLSTINSDQSRHTSRHNAPRSATEASAESHMEKFVASFDAAEGTMTPPPPPAVQLSAAGQLPSSLRAISSSSHRREEERTEGPLSSVGWPTRFVP